MTNRLSPAAPTALVFLACSGRKLTHPAPAFELYQGVMYGTFRSNVKQDAQPAVAVLSALHGFISAEQVIAPYDLRMSQDRSQAMLNDLDAYLAIRPPAGIPRVLLAGGQVYRTVMRAAVRRLIEQGRLARDIAVAETTGGIGYQRQQLREFLGSLAPADPVVGRMPNGTALYGRLGGFKVGQSATVAYRCRPDIPPVVVRIEELFIGPTGPTACVRAPHSRFPERNPQGYQKWVALSDIVQPSVLSPLRTAPA